MQYVPSGVFFARVRHQGKLFRQSLETDVFTTAKLRLPDKLNELRKPKAEVGTFMDGRLKYEAETQNDYTLAPLSKTYRLRCVECLVRTWPGVDKLKVDSIEEADCGEWAARYAALYSPTVFNNTANTLRRILALAGLGHDAKPAMKLERLGMRHKKLELPTSDQFERLVALIETSGAAQARDCADLVRFLAFTGCRISEAKQAIWADVSWELNELTVHCVKRRLTSSAALTRILPLIPALKQLLERLRADRKPKLGDHICAVFEAQGSLTRACRLVGPMSFVFMIAANGRVLLRHGRQIRGRVLNGLHPRLFINRHGDDAGRTFRGRGRRLVLHRHLLVNHEHLLHLRLKCRIPPFQVILHFMRLQVTGRAAAKRG